MNKKTKTYYIWILVLLLVILITIGVIILCYQKSIRINIYEKMSNYTSKKMNNDNTFLRKCFDKKTLDSFEKYNKNTTILRIPHGIICTTPNKYIKTLPQITWNGVFLNNLCVDPKMRNKGLGTKLVLMVITEAKKTGKDHIILQVEKRNISAVKIYEKLGFKKYFEGVNENGEKSIIYIYYL